MRAVAVSEAGRPALREVSEPALEPGGVLVRVRYCGLCGSDSEKLVPGGAAAGSVLGHELSGVVVAGALAAGTRVAVAHHVPCGACSACASGHEPLCPHFAASALVPGGFCELTAASADHTRHAVLPLPATVADLDAILVEPLACVLRGLEALPPDGSVLVVGAGAIGLLAASALVASGREAVVVDTDPARQRDAGERGHRAPRLGERLGGAFLTAPGGLGAAIDALAGGGTLVAFAGGSVQPLDLDTVYRRELRVCGVRSCTPRHLRAALALLASGAVATAGLIDCVLPLEDFDDGLRRYRAREARKVVFAP